MKGRPVAAALFLLSSVMHALGHAGLAAAGGQCVRLLTSVSTSMDARSTTVENLALIGMFAAIVKMIGGVAATYLQSTLSSDVGRRARLDVLDAWLAAHSVPGARQRDQGGAPKLSVGAYAQGVTRLTTHIREIEDGLEVGCLGGIRAAVQLIPLLVLLVWIAPSLALSAALVMVPFGILVGRARKRWKESHARAIRAAEGLTEAADDAIRHADVWRVYGAQSRIRSHLDRIGGEIARATARVRAYAAAMSGANELLGAFAFVTVIVALRKGWLPSAPSDLVPFAIVFFLSYKPIRELSDARLALLKADHALEDLFPSSTTTANTNVEPPETSPPWALSELRLHGVTTAHGKHEAIDTVIQPGEIVAISAPTGTGKTSLLRALLGLDSFSTGRVHYGDRELKEGAFGPAARPFAWVPQDAPLIADSLAHNVELGAAAAPASDALRTIGAHDLTTQLGDARLGAGGRAVSGGERQWISLARAIATRQPVLLLDEPTSGLDSASEERVLETIRRFKGERTVVMVTHRPAPLKIADRVLTLGA